MCSHEDIQACVYWNYGARESILTWTYIKCAHAKMHWLLVRSSMVKFIPFYRERGGLGIVIEGSGYYSFFLYISLVYLSSHQQREQKQNRHLCFI